VSARQRGVAAITAILIVAVAASAATIMLAQQSAMVDQATLISSRAQADMYARAGLDWARGVVMQDTRSSNNVDSLDEAWAQPIVGLPVDRALITHAHGDHARWGSRQYLGAREGELVLRTRLGPAAAIETVPFGEPVVINGVRVSFHPAGHILGSAQIRVEHAGQVWVVSGDYKTEPDPTCTAFEPVRCQVFITESTFGLPIYRWQPPRETQQAHERIGQNRKL